MHSISRALDPEPVLALHITTNDGMACVHRGLGWQMGISSMDMNNSSNWSPGREDRGGCWAHGKRVSPASCAQHAPTRTGGQDLLLFWQCASGVGAPSMRMGSCRALLMYEDVRLKRSTMDGLWASNGIQNLSRQVPMGPGRPPPHRPQPPARSLTLKLEGELELKPEA